MTSLPRLISLKAAYLVTDVLRFFLLLFYICCTLYLLDLLQVKKKAIDNNSLFKILLEKITLFGKWQNLTLIIVLDFRPYQNGI